MTAAPESSGAHLLRALHEEHGAALWRYALSLTSGDPHQAQDVVQETLIRAWRNPSAFDSDRGSPRAWLYAVARRIVIDDHRSARARHETTIARFPEGVGEDATAGAVDRDLMRRAMAALTPEHREVLVACYYQRRSVAEAAETLGIPPGTVKSRSHYALRALKLALEELGGLE